MKVLWSDSPKQPLTIQERPDPQLQSGELMVRIHATALNRADLLQKRGLYPPPAGASPVLGLEMAGIVEKVGAGVVGWKIGDRVCSLLPGGGYADKVVIPANMAIPIPDSFTLEQGAALPESFLTAYLNLFDLGQLQPDQYVLIHAGASGIGTAAIQFANEVGAKVVATAGTEDKRTLCRRLGAIEAIDYRQDSFRDRVKEITVGQGVHLILDLVGASYWENNIASLRTDGRLLLIGTLGGSQVRQVQLLPLLMQRLSIMGSTLRSLSQEKKAALTQRMKELAYPRWLQGGLQPVIDSIWDWQQVNEAHQYMEENRNRGKIVLRVQ